MHYSKRLGKALSKGLLIALFGAVQVVGLEWKRGLKTAGGIIKTLEDLQKYADQLPRNPDGTLNKKAAKVKTKTYTCVSNMSNRKTFNKGDKVTVLNDKTYNGKTVREHILWEGGRAALANAIKTENGGPFLDKGHKLTIVDARHKDQNIPNSKDRVLVKFDRTNDEISVDYRELVPLITFLHEGLVYEIPAMDWLKNFEKKDGIVDKTLCRSFLQVFIFLILGAMPGGVNHRHWHDIKRIETMLAKGEDWFTKCLEQKLLSVSELTKVFQLVVGSPLKIERFHGYQRIVDYEQTLDDIAYSVNGSDLLSVRVLTEIVQLVLGFRYSHTRVKKNYTHKAKTNVEFTAGNRVHVIKRDDNGVTIGDRPNVRPGNEKPPHTVKIDAWKEHFADCTGSDENKARVTKNYKFTTETLEELKVGDLIEYTVKLVNGKNDFIIRTAKGTNTIPVEEWAEHFIGKDERTLRELVPEHKPVASMRDLTQSVKLLTNKVGELTAVVDFLLGEKAGEPEGMTSEEWIKQKKKELFNKHSLSLKPELHPDPSAPPLSAEPGDVETFGEKLQPGEVSPKHVQPSHTSPEPGEASPVPVEQAAPADPSTSPEASQEGKPSSIIPGPSTIMRRRLGSLAERLAEAEGRP